MKLLRLVALLACVLHAVPVLAADDDPFELVTAGNQAFAAGRFQEALQAYELAAEALGDSYELDYNRAAAQYKLGQYDEAARLFARAAMSPDGGLSRRARFGWGNCDYASALASLQSADPQAGQQPDLQGGMEKLESATRHYRDALAAEDNLPADHPGDRAARANIERAQRLIETIKELLEQQQQKQQDQDQQQDKQQEQNQDDQQQEEQEKEGDEQDEQQQQLNEQKKEQEDQQQEQEQPDQGQEEQQQQDQDQQQADQQEAAQQPQDQQSQAREMNEQEIEALLQAVRDKEKKRRQERMQRLRARRVPVARDW